MGSLFSLLLITLLLITVPWMTEIAQNWGSSVGNRLYSSLHSQFDFLGSLITTTYVYSVQSHILY